MTARDDYAKLDANTSGPSHADVLLGLANGAYAVESWT